MKKNVAQHVRAACVECHRLGQLTKIDNVRRILSRRKVTIGQGELLTLLHIEWKRELGAPVVRQVKRKLGKLTRRQVAFVLRGALKGKRRKVAA